jgi:molybdate transport system regulatory protein
VRVKLKLSVADDRGAPFIGSGLVGLLRRVERLGSIQSAARDIGMSYAKAHRILKRLEQGAGWGFLVRRRGGQDRGGAQLTPRARDFLARYELMEARIHAEAEKVFSGVLLESGCAGGSPAVRGRRRARPRAR